MNIKDKIIKRLGGYTKKEFQRVERKYQGLLDSKTTQSTAETVNYHIYKTILTLDNYAKEELYGEGNWASRMYNCIHNNLLRIMIRYLHTGSSVIYKFDTTIDKPKEFINILKEENINVDEDELANMFVLETD